MAYSKQNFQDGQILNAANLEAMENGIIAGQGVKNLLINSNFKDPINSSGKTSWSSSGFTIDKWRADSAATINLTSSGITVDATSVAGNLQQNIDNLPNGTYTFAALVNNVIRTIAFTNNNGTITTVDNSNASFGDSGSINAGKENSAYYVQINNAQGHTNTIAWAALYEGNYTVDTLPNYIPKDKHIEMINCGISLQPQNLLDNSNFSNPVNSRGKNTYSDEGNEYTIDRWKTKYKSNISIENGYINIFGRFGLNQYIQNPKDGIYTFAARVRINSSKYGPVIYVDENSGSSNDLFLDANIGEWKTYILQHDFSSTTSETITFAFSLRGGDTTASISVEWAAMYKGAYDASTLPAYQPKGYAAELAECQRYYQIIPEQTSCAFSTTAQSNKYFSSSINFPQMRITPTVSLKTDSNGYIGVVQGVSFVSASEFDFAYKLNGTLLPATTNANYAGKVMSFYGIELNADL